MPFSQKDKGLGVTIGITGISQHIQDITYKGKGALTELFRFQIKVK